MPVVRVVTGGVVPPSPAVEGQLVNARAVRYHHDPSDLISLAEQVFTTVTMVTIVYHCCHGDDL